MNKPAVWGLGIQAKSPNVSAVHRLNMYLEFSKVQDKTQVTAYGTPGLELFTSFGETACRGWHEKGDNAYFVHRGTLWRVDNAGVKEMLGTLDTASGRVEMEDNGQQLLVLDGTYGYIYNIAEPDPVTITSITHVGTTATVNLSGNPRLNEGQSITVTGASPSQYNGTFLVTGPTSSSFTYEMLSAPATNATVAGSYTVNYFQKITAEGFPAGPVTCTYLGGFFVVSILDSGRYYVSSAFNGYLWNALDFANAESNPDDLIAVIAEGGQLKLFGEKTMESAGLSGAQEFPFSSIQGSAVQWGLAARYSLTRTDTGLMFLARNRQGEVKVIAVNGDTPTDVTGHEMGYIFNDGSSVSNATAFSYMVDGHSMYQITFPTINETWLYDNTSGVWSQVQSKGIGRHRAEGHISLLNQSLVADYENGNVYYLKKNVYTDNGQEIARELTGKHINNSGDMLIISKLQVEMQTGVGVANGQGYYPIAMLQVSRDNGASFGNRRHGSIGKMGDRRTRVTFQRLGRGRDFVFKLRITDPVQVAITGAYLE